MKERSFQGIINALESADAHMSTPLFSRPIPLGQLFLASVFLSLWHRRSKISLLGVIMPSELPPNITLHWNDYL
jgi:hypothetical protein